MGFDVSKLVVPLLDGVFVFVFVLVFVFVFHVSKLTVPLLEGVFVLEVVFKVVSTNSCLCVHLHLEWQSLCEGKVGRVGPIFFVEKFGEGQENKKG